MVATLNIHLLAALTPYGTKKFKVATINGLCPNAAENQRQAIVLQVNGNHRAVTLKVRRAHQVIHGNNRHNRAAHNRSNHLPQVKAAAGN